MHGSERVVEFAMQLGELQCRLCRRYVPIAEREEAQRLVRRTLARGSIVLCRLIEVAAHDESLEPLARGKGFTGHKLRCRHRFEAAIGERSRRERDRVAWQTS